MCCFFRLCNILTWITEQRQAFSLTAARKQLGFCSHLPTQPTTKRLTHWRQRHCRWHVARLRANEDEAVISWWKCELFIVLLGVQQKTTRTWLFSDHFIKYVYIYDEMDWSKFCLSSSLQYGRLLPQQLTNYVVNFLNVLCSEFCLHPSNCCCELSAFIVEIRLLAILSLVSRVHIVSFMHMKFAVQVVVFILVLMFICSIVIYQSSAGTFSVKDILCTVPIWHLRGDWWSSVWKSTGNKCLKWWQQRSNVFYWRGIFVFWSRFMLVATVVSHICFSNFEVSFIRKLFAVVDWL